MDRSHEQHHRVEQGVKSRGNLAALASPIDMQQNAILDEVDEGRGGELTEIRPELAF
jgi:hypothetical protein